MQNYCSLLTGNHPGRNIIHTTSKHTSVGCMSSPYMYQVHSGVWTDSRQTDSLHFILPNTLGDMRSDLILPVKTFTFRVINLFWCETDSMKTQNQNQSDSALTQQSSYKGIIKATSAGPVYATSPQRGQTLGGQKSGRSWHLQVSFFT